MTDVQGWRRALRHGQALDRALDDDTWDVLAVVLILETVRDLARLPSMRTGDDRAGPWRSRRYCINTLVDALLTDLSNDDATEIERLKAHLASSAYVPGRSRKR